jgi:hypothetical protein
MTTFTSSKARMGYTPSLSRNRWRCSSVTTSPRDGSTGTPPRTPERCFRPGPGNASPRRASVESTCPAVPPSRWASSLAACSTSFSMSNVVLMHLMLLHHRIKVNAGWPPTKTGAHGVTHGRILILPPNYKPRGARRLRRFSVVSPKINRFVRLRSDIEAA